MTRKRKPLGFVAFAIFAVFVLIGGYALNATGYIDNPFDQISYLVSWTTGGEPQFTQGSSDASGAVNLGDLGSGLQLPADTSGTVSLDSLTSASSQFQLPTVSDLQSTTATDSVSGFALQENPPDGGRDGQSSIVWSDIGDVLYDLWFICAVTVVFIVVQRIVKFSIKQIKSALPAAAAA